MNIVTPIFTSLILGCLSPAALGLELFWELLPGRAQDIGVGADGSVWIVGSGSDDGDIFRWNGTSWTPIGGSGVLIAVGANGDPWVVNSNSDLFHRVNNQWVLITVSGAVTGIGVSPDGSVLVTGGTFDYWAYYDRPLYRYIPGGDFVPLPGLGVVIEPDGNGWWVLDNSGHISRWMAGDGYRRIEGHARDISRSANGEVWIIGDTGRIFRWNGSQFDLATTGQASKISVGPDGHPWVVSGGKIFHGHPLFLIATDSTVPEGDPLRFPITLSYPSDRPASVAYRVLGPDNTVATSGSLNFSPGQTNQIVTVATVADTVFQDTRRYRLELTNAVGVDLIKSFAIGSVIDNDAESPTIFPKLSAGGGFAVRCASRPGFNYQLQRRETLEDGTHWIPLVALTGTGGSIELGDAARPTLQGFYRVVVTVANP